MTALTPLDPTPTPGPSPVTIGGVTLGAPPKKTGTGADLYGLGPWGGQQVQAGDLGIPLLGNTGDDIMKALADADPQAKALIQRSLLFGGWYGTDSTYQPMLGNLHEQDYQAFAAAIIAAGRQKLPVGQLLRETAAYGVANGIAAAQAQAAKNSVQNATVNRVTVPSLDDLAYAADQAFQKIDGRRANPAEKAAFARSYQTLAVQMQKSNDQAAFNAAQAAIQAPTTRQANQDAAAAAGQAPPTLPHGLAVGADSQYIHGSSAPPEGPSFAEDIGNLSQTLQQRISELSTPASQAGTLTEVPQDTPPSVGVAAENFARNADPHASAAGDLNNTFQQFLQLLSGKL